jgi:hypothetical protein
MLTVDRLTLRLPAGFEQRSDEILQLVASELARLHLPTSGQLDTLQLPAIEVEAHWDNRQLAGRICQVVQRELMVALPAPRQQTGRAQS